MHVLIDVKEAAPRWYGAIEQLALKEPAALVQLAEQATERVEMNGLRRELILAELLDAWEQPQNVPEQPQDPASSW